MSKKLLAAAIATAVAAPMAVAADSNNVTVYGKAHVMVVKTNLDNGFPSGAVDDEGNRLRNKVNDWAVGSTNSRIGFKGSEDLGNGLKAIWKYETTVNISDGAAEGGLFGSARNAYLGLSSEWGSLLVGRHDTPAKVAWYAAGNDHLDGSIIDFNTIGFATGGVGGQQLTTFMDARLDNTIAYISPSFAGFTFAGAIIPGEQDDGPQNNIADNWSVGAMWSGYGFKASAGYEHFDWSEPRPPFPPTSSGIENLEEQKSWFVAGSWTYSVFTIGATYQKDKDFEGLSDQDTWGSLVSTPLVITTSSPTTPPAAKMRGLSANKTGTTMIGASLFCTASASAHPRTLPTTPRRLMVLKTLPSLSMARNKIATKINTVSA
jgi:predicted porin